MAYYQLTPGVDVTSKLTPDRIERWLEAFSNMANVAAACKATGIARYTIYDLRKRDKEFRDAMDSAKEVAIESLEAECWRRGRDGYQEPIYQSGELVGYKTRYSDRLAEMLLRANAPDKYKDRREVSINLSLHDTFLDEVIEGDFERVEGGDGD